jgi:hypothetical protein
MMADAVPCGPDPARYVETVRSFVDASFDAVHVQQIGPDQDDFFELWATEVAPRLESTAVPR